MSLVALLEGCKDVAIAKREEVAARAAEDVAEFEEYGADLAAAFDEEEISAAEEALRLGLQLDEREDEESSERERRDLELAREILAAEEDTDSACGKDEMMAQLLEAQLRQEAIQVAKLERRERKLSEKKLCKGDLAMAEQLAFDIEQQEEELRMLERKDRKLAAVLVKEESKALASLPQTEEKLRTLNNRINGEGPVPMRTRLRAKLGLMRKGVSDITNKMEQAAEVGGMGA